MSHMRAPSLKLELAWNKGTRSRATPSHHDIPDFCLNHLPSFCGGDSR